MIKFANRFFLLFLITLTLLSAEEKKKALVEYAGSTQCPYCPQVTVLLDRYLDPSHPDYFGKDIVDKMVVVRYHTYNPGYGDPMYATIGGASCEADFTCVRINGEVSKEWYQISGVPSVFIDGTKTNNYLGDVKTTQAETTPVKISLEGSTFNDLTVNAKVTITSETDLSAEPLYLFVMATMDSVHYVGANGETEHEQVFLGFMGDTGPGLGKAITLSNTQAIEWTHTWTLPSDYPNEANGRDLGLISDWNTTVWDKKNMNLVAFVQNKTTLEVVQTEMISRRTMPVSQSPVVTAIADITIDEDNSKTLDIIATDPDGDAITYSALSDTNAVTTSISASTLTLTPKANWNGVATITAYASDGTHKDSTTFKLTVTPVNDIAAIADVTIDEDKSAEVALTNTFTGTITFTAVSVSDSVTASISASTLTLTPNANWNGATNITAYVSDGTYTDSTSFDLTVNPVQDAPSAFEWVTSSVLDTININESNLTDTYTLQWSPSTDIDGDSINYLLYAQIGVYPVEEIYDTTSLSVPITYQEILEGVFEGSLVNGATVRFNVKATDGVDTVDVTGENRVIYVNRYDYLSVEGVGIPTEFALHENYPNPFNPTTTLRFDLPEVSNITLTIFNMLGQKIRTYDMQSAAAGYHTLKWNATNDYGDPVGAGVYLYQLQTKDFVRTRKMVLLK